MADQYNGSFFHPNFVIADYGTEFGSGVNFSPSGLTFKNTGFPRVRGFEHRIFSSNYLTIFTWEDIGVVSSGSVSHSSGFRVPLSVAPFEDFIEIQVGINTSASPHEFRVTFICQQGIYNVMVPWTQIVAGKTGYIYCWVGIGEDKGSGNCDINCYVQIPDYSINVSLGPLNYNPNGNTNEWYTQFYGISSDYGKTSLLSDHAILSRFLPINSIISSEAWGLPLVSTDLQTVNMNSIPSSETWGSFSISISQQYVIMNSISSGEAFGTPGLSDPIPSQSVLPEVFYDKEGDIRIEWNPEKNYFEFILGDRDLERDAGLETAVLITLLTDKYVDDVELLPDDSGYKGGWWADSIPVVENYKMGTKLWLLRRAKTTENLLARAREYLIDGFQWMVEDGIVDKINVEVNYLVNNKSAITFVISLFRPEGTTVFYNFYYNWEAQILRGN